MKPQLWYCEMCGILGSVMFKENDDIMPVIRAIEEQHRKASPDCENDARGLRVIAIQNIREPFILRPTEPVGGRTK